MIRAGKLLHPITIERPAEVLDAHGVPSAAYSTIAEARAELVQASTEEFLKSYGSTAEIVSVFRIRFVADVRLSDRIGHAGRKHEIKEIKELGRRQGLEIRTVARGQ